jgi:uncharacterized ferritin-like protein (DUF455 family)
MITIRHEALSILLEPDPERKAQRARELPADRPCAELDIIEEPTGIPGRPERPSLVPHTGLKQRSLGTIEGRAALIHALALRT